MFKGRDTVCPCLDLGPDRVVRVGLERDPVAGERDVIQLAIRVVTPEGRTEGLSLGVPHCGPAVCCGEGGACEQRSGPGGFYIDTPVGKYNPDWAIAFYEGSVKHIYFVAETKGDLPSLQLRPIESLKILCAREHFKRISSNLVKYDVVTNYTELLNAVTN